MARPRQCNCNLTTCKTCRQYAYQAAYLDREDNRAKHRDQTKARQNIGIKVPATPGDEEQSDSPTHARAIEEVMQRIRLRRAGVMA